MKIKVRNKIFDGNNEPIMLILTDKDKENIRKMKTDCHKFFVFPDTMKTEKIEKWMKEKEENIKQKSHKEQ